MGDKLVSIGAGFIDKSKVGGVSFRAASPVGFRIPVKFYPFPVNLVDWRGMIAGIAWLIARIRPLFGIIKANIMTFT